MTARFEQGFPQTTQSVTGTPNPPTGTLPDQAKNDAADRKARPAQGFWLTGDPEKVAKDIHTKWTAQDKGMKSRLARWDLNVARREGDSYSKLVKDTDKDSYRVYTPRGVDQAPPSLNKTDDLCIKVVANLNVDPPKPECEPSSDADEDRDAADFSTRVLMNESTESGLNLPSLVEEAEDLACSYGSGFVYTYVDPQGGGWRPREIMASQAATTVEDALFTLAPEQPATTDPTAGAKVPGAPAQKVAQPEPYVIRYVAEDGVTLTDDPAQAEREWLPSLCAETLTGEQVRFLPETASGIKDADGLLIATPVELGHLKTLFPETVGTMDADKLRKLVSYRPEISKRIIPKHAGSGEGTKGPDWKAEDGPPDDAICVVITAYREGSGAYPLGAYVVMGGEKLLLHRDTWHEEVPSVSTGQPVQRAMDVPVAQFRQFRAPKKNKDPYGRGLVDLVGDGDPLVSFGIGAIVEYLHRVNNPHLFVPVGSGIQPKSLALPRGTPIPYNPAGGGVPKQEEIEPLSPTFMEFIQFVRGEQNTRSGLEQAAQGVASASVQSGKHAQQIIEQALVSLGGVKHGMEYGYLRLCRIVLQLVRKYYTRPQRLRVVGEDGAFKEQEWTGADLRATTDVKIMAGTSTMLAQSAKSALALEKFQAGAISQDDYNRMERGNVRVLIGIQDNPHLLRVQGQIAEWKAGPPEGWTPAAAPVDLVTGQPPTDPATGQPLPLPPDPRNPFADQRPIDQEQAVAIVRHAELQRAIASAKYRVKPPAWQQFLLAEYDLMRRAAGVATLAEQQAAQAQAQQQEFAQQQAAADRQHGQRMEAQGASDDRKSALEQQRAENQMAATPPGAPAAA